MPKINKYKFEPGALSIIQMGEELVGHPTTAINELVKNGYDADATVSKVYINYDKSNSKSFIVISDNGLGMNNTTLFGDWLKPSVSSKRNGEGKSKIFQRNFLGSKGIGRLASMALGRYLTVISKTSQEEVYNWLFIDRHEFREETLLSNIEFPGGVSTSVTNLLKEEEIIGIKGISFNNQLIRYIDETDLDNFKEGTLIIVEELDDSIKTIIEDEALDGDKDIDEMSLVRSLKVLVTPLLLNQSIQEELVKRKILDKKYQISSPESSFEIRYGSNLLPGDSIQDQFIAIDQFSILENFDYRVLGKVDKSGSILGIYVCNRLIEDSYEIPFQLTSEEVFSDEGSRKRVAEKIVTKSSTDRKVGQFFFDIRIYDRDPEAINKLSAVLKTSGRRETADVLDRFIGLRISKNGFGVKPYGEQDKDWMGMGEMRVQDPSMILGTNQIIGNVFLFSSENDALNEKTNREGFFENEAFISFKKILRAVLIEAGKRRNNYRQKHAIGRKISSKHNRPDITRFIHLIESITTDKNAIKEAKTYLSDITTALDNLENSLTFSQRLATLGSGLELVYHEMAQPTSIIGKCLYSMKFSISQIQNQDLRDELLKDSLQIKNAISTLDKLKESLEPAIGKSKQTEFKPIDIFNKVCYLFTKDLISNKISVEISKNLNDFSIKDSEYNLWIAFLNILNNAVYWLKTDHRTNRKILFELGENDQMIISNNGPMIDEGELENIFNYGVTHKKIKNATGLGLAFTRSLLSKNDWEIWSENKEQGPAFIIQKLK